MKKILVLLLTFLFSTVFFVNKASAGPSIDQQFTSGQGSVAINLSYGNFAQVFKPTMSNLSKVELELTGISTGPQTMSIVIRHRIGTSWQADNLAEATNSGIANGWNTFDFDDIAVQTGPNDTYGIWTTTSSSQIQWKYADISGYNYGYAIWQSIDKANWDYNFKTWGTNPVENVDENTQPGNQNSNVSTPAGQTADTGAAPATTTSAAIKAPSDLKVEYANTSANLTWTKSTTDDITGYKIFRSESANKNFKEVGKTVKGTLTYKDTKDLTVGKTFYYFVRAYKGTEESASSSTVALLIPEATATTNTNTNRITPISETAIDSTDYKQVEIVWILVFFASALLVILVAYEIELRRKGSTSGAKHFRLFK